MISLTSDTLKLFDLPDCERAQACMRDVFIMFPAAMAAEDHAKALLSLPRCNSNAGMSLIALPGQGKSTLGMEWMRQSQQPSSGWPGKLIYINILENPMNVHVEKLLLSQIGKIFCGHPLTLSYRDIGKAQDIILENNVRGVFLDETPFLLRCKDPKESQLMSIIGLSEGNWPLNFILSGPTIPMNKVFDANPVLSTRYFDRVSELPVLCKNNDFFGLVAGIMERMPLRSESELDKYFMEKLLELTRTKISYGKITIDYSPLRTVSNLLRETCRQAVVDGTEFINAQGLVEMQKKMRGYYNSKVYRERYYRT
ncbi:TniB family NTP-binding protein [Pseudomonas mosselii]|uniref:TniB family NTP-binding protein n=1 Tax=Pseudomonas mosselii TaxID=78327 RepID=UPI003D297E39